MNKNKHTFKERLQNYKFTSLQLANSILESTIAREIKTNLPKLMKLSYITVGYCLYFDFDPIVEEIQAWKHFPVIPSLWQAFKEYGVDKNITELSEEIDFDSFEIYTPVIKINNKDMTNKRTITIISYIVDKYKDDTSWDLVHGKKGTTWETVFEDNKRNIVIPRSNIQEYYKSNFDLEIT